MLWSNDAAKQMELWLYNLYKSEYISTFPHGLALK